MKKIIISILIIMALTVLIACGGEEIASLGISDTLETIDAPELVEPVQTPVQEDETPKLETPQKTTEDFAALIMSAEQVYCDIMLGNLFSGYVDYETDVNGIWVMNEHLEYAAGIVPDYILPYYHVLPSSGFTSIDELNAALHMYWGNDFEVYVFPPGTEAHSYLEHDGELYYFGAPACTSEDFLLGVNWETTKFEVLTQTDEYTVIHADVSDSGGYKYTMQWEIRDNRIVARDMH